MLSSATPATRARPRRQMASKAGGVRAAWRPVRDGKIHRFASLSADSTVYWGERLNGAPCWDTDKAMVTDVITLHVSEDDSPPWFGTSHHPFIVVFPPLLHFTAGLSFKPVPSE